MNIQSASLRQLFRQLHLQRGMLFGAIMISALLSFELFNYSTTEYALTDLLGSLRFAGIHWATILSIAFCGIDFAGIARLFTPSVAGQQRSPAMQETWYLFGAWLLAATMNATLTWWGVSIAILSHQAVSASMIGQTALMRVVPVFVALMVWLIRVLIIGSFSAAGDNLFVQSAPPRPQSQGYGRRPALPQSSRQTQLPRSASAAPGGSFSRQPLPLSRSVEQPPEPTYHPLSAAAHTLGKTGPARPNSSATRRF